MTDMRDLYQEVILDHYKKPRNYTKPANVSQQADGRNPLCGDKVTVYLFVKDGRATEIGFEGSGCAISTASASMMTESVKGKTVGEIEKLFHRFHGLVTSDKSVDPSVDLGKLEVFSGVREFPVRVKCASLAWHTLMAALENKGELVTTE